MGQLDGRLPQAGRPRFGSAVGGAGRLEGPGTTAAPWPSGALRPASSRISGERPELRIRSPIPARGGAVHGPAVRAFAFGLPGIVLGDEYPGGVPVLLFPGTGRGEGPGPRALRRGHPRPGRSAHLVLCPRGLRGGPEETGAQSRPPVGFLRPPVPLRGIPSPGAVRDPPRPGRPGSPRGRGPAGGRCGGDRSLCPDSGFDGRLGRAKPSWPRRGSWRSKEGSSG
ncbi:MAG: hypothetical protein MZV70_35670 [Desulfobacterales bacterium]|nr:hypothetical protein [Desulfobacterales bacterium]